MDINQTFRHWLRPRNIVRQTFRLLPREMRFELLRRQLKLDLVPPHSLKIKIAETREEMERAFTILHDEYVRAGFMNADPSGMRITPYHALPSTTTLVAVWNGAVAGTVSIIRDSGFGFPLDSAFDTRPLKRQGSRVAEISALAIDRRFRQNRGAVLFPLIKYVIEYCMKYFGSDSMVIAVNPAHIEFYEAILGFQRLPGVVERYDFVNGAPAVGAYISFREFYDRLLLRYGEAPPERNLLRYILKTDFPNLEYPDRAYFKVSDPRMTPELLEYFFSRRTKVFESLPSKKRAILRSLYTDSAYRRVLPEVPKSRVEIPRRKEVRFDVDCRGRIILSANRVVKMTVKDVSLEGFRALLSEPIRFGGAVRIHIAVGEFQFAELRAWPVRRAADGIYGFYLSRSDETWRAFLNYLRQDQERRRA